MKGPLALLLALLALAPLRAIAGPPFDTDDPDPTEYRNYEIYSGFQTHVDQGTTTTESPFIEVNYGLLPNVQFSVHWANDADDPGDGTLRWGFSDAEMGLKYRFIQETAHTPQVAFYPQVTYATAVPENRMGVGLGHGSLLLPVWAQKTIGKVTVFGGGGFTFDRDDSGPGAWQAGLAATVPISDLNTVGIEVTRVTPHAGYQQSDVGIGFIHAVGALHSLLFSAGRTFDAQPHYRAYAAYGWVLGPKEKTP